MLVADAPHDDPRTEELMRIGEFDDGTALLDAPIRLEGEVVGVISHEQIGAPRPWEPEDVDFAGSVANLASLALEAVNRRRAEEERQRSETRYRSLFESSPISLWQQDFSATKALLADLRASGVVDWHNHFRLHPDDLARAIRSVHIEEVNEATLHLHRVGSKDELLAGLQSIFTKQSEESFIDQLAAIAGGESSYEGTTTDRTMDGRDIHVAIRWTAAPGYRESLKRVLVSKLDITAAVEAERSLQRALDGTIEAIGMATETRDPYTAGHQRRVTQLAVAIARKLGADQEVIEGTRVAGLMHDIGKLAIPAEILSKPSKLSDMERSLIQSHPQAAYDILKTVAFPWPIAQIVLQHHERLDGTGYPHALVARDIRIESRILAVADTVEAMASHRPYRPALGIENALEEVEQGRGVAFDPNVVDACLSLFRTGEFSFDDHPSELASHSPIASG